MSVILGIDIGGSATKIAACDEAGRLLTGCQARGSEPLVSAYGAFGKLLETEGIALSQIEKIAVTGVGAQKMGESIYGIPLVRVSEFQAIGRGALALSGQEKALIVNMGTGSAFVRAEGKKTEHLGGTGAGGGALTGLCQYLFNIREFGTIIEAAEEGDLGKVDLRVGEISEGTIGGLGAEITAANFGKLSDNAKRGDVILGLINLIMETVGMMAVFACRNDDLDTVVITGALADMPQMDMILRRFNLLCPLHFLVPERAPYATAFGAVLALLEK